MHLIQTPIRIASLSRGLVEAQQNLAQEAYLILRTLLTVTLTRKTDAPGSTATFRRSNWNHR